MWTTYLRLIYHLRGREKMKRMEEPSLGYPNDSLDLRIWSDVRNIMSDHVGLWRGHMFSGRVTGSKHTSLVAAGSKSICVTHSQTIHSNIWMGIDWRYNEVWLVLFTRGKALKQTSPLLEAASTCCNDLILSRTVNMCHASLERRVWIDICMW